jgi:O-methyltransferase
MEEPRLIQYGPLLRVVQSLYHRLPAPALRVLRALRLEIARVRQERWYTEWALRREYLTRAFETLEFNGITGDYAEFGSWSGQTLSLAYHASRRVGLKPMLWAFDSFQGLPSSQHVLDVHRKWQSGAMKMPLDEFHAQVGINGVPRHAYQVVVGFYEDTLRTDNSSLPSDLALIYIDCDMYTSTATVLKFLEPRLKHGMLIALDDYFAYSPTSPSGEKLALEEFFGKHPEWRLVPHIQYNWGSQSFVVERA